ncbi:MAG: type II secretion system inner membrane protein GspF [Pseudomonadota bacterium]
MPAFEYSALDTNGKEQKGVLEGDTARQIRQQLREKKLTPLSVTEGAAKATQTSTGSGFRGSISTTDLALVTRQLATLASSGTPVEEALAAVSRQTEKQRVKTLLLSVRSKVLEGHSLADSLSEFPKVFPEIYRATVAAGEQSGHLEGVLERLADHTEERQATQASISKALIYPAGLIVFSILIVGLLLAYVVPDVVQIFEEMDQELPTMTIIVLAMSDLTRNWGVIALIVVVLAVIAFQRAMRNEEVKYRVHTVFLRMPIFKRLIRYSNSAQFARTLSILASSGVPVLDALNIASDVLTNRPMRLAVREAAVQVREGASLNKSLEKTGHFPPMMLHLIASGESSGRLSQMLEKAATHQERELNSAIAIFLGLFQPMIVLIMGGVVLFIVLAILMPIMQLNQLVQ